MAIGQSDGSIILSTKVDTKGIKQGTNSIMAMAQKAGSALAVAFSVKKIADFVKASVDAFAEYEQLVGGVETLFKKSADKVMKYANEAYKTAGMSANEYMANVTSFSASLLSSLEGDTDKAAEVANAALISISDNANKMGTNMESVTMAFQGFAKQQYMLLDNLKLGYGGTKTEMERLLKDAQAITGVEYNIDNLADVYTAIGVIQEKLGIAGTTAKEAATTISGSAGMMKASWQNVLVAISGGGDMDAAIENLANSVDIYFDNILPVVEKAIKGIGLLIEKIAPKLAESVGKAFIKEIPRLTTAIYSLIIGAFKGLYRGIVELFRKETNNLIEEQTEKTEETAQTQEKLTDNIKDTNEELKKSLAGFDEIQILSAQSAENVENTNKTNGETDNIITPDGSAYVKEADETLNPIMEIVYDALIAVGLILLFTGNVAWGTGLIIAGAISKGYTIGNNSKNDSFSALEESLTSLQRVATGAAIALGCLMLFMGSKKLGISLIAYGVLELAFTIYEISQFSTSPIEDTINTIQDIAAGAMLAIGFFLLYFKVNIPLAISLIAGGALLVVDRIFDIAEDGATPEISAWINGIMLILEGAALVIGIILLVSGVNLPLGISLVASGAVALAKEVTLNWNTIVEMLSGTIGNIVAIISGALLVLGVILVCVGVFPIGIGLIVAGAIGLATVVAVNWDAIVEKVKEIFNAVLEWIKTYGLLVLGILLCLTGTGIPLGIALIVKWAKDGAENGVPIATAIVDKVKEIWASIKAFWDENIAPIFTAKFWLDLAKECGNGLIAGFEAAINGIITMFEKMINWIVDGLNKISFDIPDWLGGGSFGINLPRADFGRVKIPRLAQGTVVPPNKEFMAVLGDNTKEHEIVSPISTMKQAFMEAMVEMGGVGQTTKEEHYYLDETELMGVVYRLFRGGERINGASLVDGGV